MIFTELRTSALCVDCAVCSDWDIKVNDLFCLFLLFLFPSSVDNFSQLFYRWYGSTLHFVHAPSCSVFTPSPSGSSFFCLPCLLVQCTLMVSGLYMWQSSNKFIIITLKTNAERQRIYSSTLVSCVCLFVICLPWCPVDPNQMGRLSPCHKEDINTAAEWASSQPTVSILCSLRHLQGLQGT